MFDNEKDTTIIYQGGSGGFFLFYLMLLSGKYCCGVEGLEKIINLDTVWNYIRVQFPFSLNENRLKWKEKEFWPDNINFKKRKSDQAKLFLICNPLFNKDCFDDNFYVSQETRKILLYTDLSTQLRLAYDKGAYWFTDTSKNQFKSPKKLSQYLKQIKNSYEFYDKEKVDPKVIRIISVFKPSIILKLQDLLNLSDLNLDQKKFVNYWLSLQGRKGLVRLNSTRLSF